ncbi:MAG: cobyrinate a,c-diamide synthase [Desulfobulbaceae bacterium]|jgi:cobyrinic acid a,c-diamide synthase|nr:cobyrinate a,c-diamide synthase [Desulfobulbaceae bacterium]
MSQNAFVIAGVSSGCGKTTVTLGLMAALAARGLVVAPYKCGPDFIDPSLHQLVTGAVSTNLDLWMMGESFTRQVFSQRLGLADIGVIEGVMGMFDGGPSSCGALAAFLGLPVILVIDARAMAESAAAIVRGFENFRADAMVVGVILNRIAGERHFRLAANSIEKHCQAKVLGSLPLSLDFAIPSRHLGLLTGDEEPLSRESIDMLARTVARHIDVEAALRLSAGRFRDEESAETSATVRRNVGAERIEKRKNLSRLCRIAVARDRAFCFYYQDNFDLLRQAGAELVFFSPLMDNHLPENISAIYLGGGYPELYAAALSDNAAMRAQIREFAEYNGVIYAECGGFMYLCQALEHDEKIYPMVGIFPVAARMKKSRARLGYRQITTREAGCFGPAGTVLRGHEFHYSEIDAMPDQARRIYALDNGQDEGYALGRTLGGYMHLHFASNPEAIQHFLAYCAG